MLKLYNFGFCPQFGCGKGMDKFVDNLRKICWCPVLLSEHYTQVIQLVIHIIHLHNPIHSLCKYLINNKYTTTKYLIIRYKRVTNDSFPRFTQYPPLPIPFIY